MKNHPIKSLAAAICISLLAGTTAADTRLEQRLAETEARLNLSEEQIKQVRPVLELNFISSKDVLAKYGVDLESGDTTKKHNNSKRLGFRDARKLSQELEAVRASTLRELSDMLTEAQLAKYRQLQAERKAALRQRLRNRGSDTQG